VLGAVHNGTVPTHTGVGPVQSTVPAVKHGSVGVQGAPALQVHCPVVLHARFVPQALPAGSCEPGVTSQTGPVVHDVVPAL
jgi:hypothetical protein